MWPWMLKQILSELKVRSNKFKEKGPALKLQFKKSLHFILYNELDADNLHKMNARHKVFSYWSGLIY